MIARLEKEKKEIQAELEEEKENDTEILKHPLVWGSIFVIALAVSTVGLFNYWK